MRRPVLLLAVALVAGATAGCASSEAAAAPRCRSDQRTGIVAQAVPGAAFVPCIETLAPGWRITSFDVGRGSARLSLRSDRADRPVSVRFTASCDVDGATPVAPRGDGVRTYLRLDGITPRYAGELLDVFPGGCVRYAFDLERGPHITLLDELESTVRLHPRGELRRELEEDLGINLSA